MMNKDPIEIVKALPEEEQSALEVMAVICQPVNLTMLKGCMGQAGLSYQGINMIWRHRMVQEELISLAANRFQLMPEIQSFLTQRMALQGRYETVYNATKNRIELPFARLAKDCNHLYSGDWDEVRKQLKNTSRYYTTLPNNYIINMVYIDDEWLAILPEDIRLAFFLWLSESTVFTHQGLFSLSELQAMFDKYSTTDTSDASKIYACFSAELALWRGDITQAKSLLDGVAHDRAQALRARLALMCDHASDALSIYEPLMAKQQYAELSRLDHIFYLLTLWSNKKYDQIHQYVDYLLNNLSAKQKKEQAYFIEALIWINDVVELGEKNIPVSTDRVVQTLINLDRSPGILNQCLLFLGFSWYENIVDSQLQLQFIQLIFRSMIEYKEEGWWAWQLCHALSHFDELYALSFKDDLKTKMPEESKELEATEKCMQQAGFVSLFSLLPHEEEWERSLHALMSVAPTTQVSQSHSTERLVWLLLGNGNDLNEVEVRLQKITKSGRWSKGRKVALERLHGSSAKKNFPFINEQDINICQVVREEVDVYWSYREYSYSISLAAILPHAVGADNIFLHDVNTPLEISQGEITLQVSTEGETIRLCLFPHPDEALIFKEDYIDDDMPIADPVVVQWKSPQHLCIYPVAPQIMKISEIIAPKGLSIPLQAKEQALEGIAAIAPLLNVHSDIGGGNQQSAIMVDYDPRLHIHLQPMGDGLQVACYVRPFGEQASMFMRPGDGGVTVFTEVDGKVLQTKRDLQAEEIQAQGLFNQCAHLNAEDAWNWQLEEPSTALETLECLQNKGDEIVLEWPEGKKITVGKSLGMSQMRVSMNKQQDWFSLEGEIEVSEDQVVSIKQLMGLMSNSPGRFVKLGDEQYLSLSQSLQQRLRALQSVTEEGRFHQLAAGAIDELTDGMHVRKNQHWMQHLKKLEQARDYQPELPSTLQAELRDYQREGFEWMARLTHWGAGACLADDMGLGKTVQALALILSSASQGPTLVIAPTSVCMNWEDEAARFAPTLNVHNFAVADREPLIQQAGAFDLVVCSYALLQRNGELLTSREWQTIVLDEAQAIKNSMTKRSKIAMQLDASVRLITTGTPIENHLGELWTLFQFINPGLLGSLESFNRRFANPIQLQEDQQVAQRLRQLVQPFILRRLKSAVLTELPPRTEITIQVEMSKEEQALYEAVRRQAMENIEQSNTDNPGEQRIRMLAEIMRMRRACCHPTLVMPETAITGSKLQVFGEMLQELRENKHKALVFSQFVDHLAIIRRYLEDNEFSYQYLDGSTPAVQRKKRVKAFQGGEGDVFLISLKAGGAGLNLTAADYVFHMDPWWNPAVEDQASDRAHRMGQKRPVTIYRLITKNTIEDKIIELHHRKRDLADSLLAGSDSGGQLSLDDIMKLVEHSAD